MAAGRLVKFSMLWPTKNGFWAQLRTKLVNKSLGTNILITQP